MPKLPTKHEGTGGAVAELLEFLKSIPGMGRAISRLVIGGGEAGAAWLDAITAKGEQQAQRIRDDTAARTALAKAVVRAGASQIASDPALVQRGVDRWIGEELRKQENREGVAVKALDYLRDEPPAHEVEGPPDDWMNVFASYAERASSDQLQAHWARILAGEIRSPGSVSLMTLQFMSVVDQKLAPIVERCMSWAVNDRIIPMTKCTAENEALIDLMTLDGLGLLKTEKNFNISVATTFPLIFDKLAIVLQNLGPKPISIGLPCAVLSPIGLEVLRILKRTEDLATARKMAAEMKELSPAMQVHLAAVTARQGDQVNYAVMQTW